MYYGRSPSAIRSSIAAQQRALAQQQARNRRLDADIARLEDAKARVDAIYWEDRGLADWVGAYDAGASWQGDRRERFEEVKRDAKSQADAYCDSVNEIYRAICNKITQLENERADGLGAVSWAYQCLNSLENELSWAVRNWDNG